MRAIYGPDGPAVHGPSKPYLNLETLLVNLTSDEAKARLIYSLVDTHDIDAKFVQYAIELFDRAGKPLLAARLSKKIGLSGIEQYGRAVGREQELGSQEHFAMAASISEEAGLWVFAINNHVSAGNPARAARLAENKGAFLQASTLYEQAKLIPDALRTAHLAKNHDRVIELCQQAGWTHDAAQYACEFSQPERAVQIYITAKKIDYAAMTARRLGLVELADKLYLQAITTQENKGTEEGRNEALYLAKEAGKIDIALGICERAHWWKKAYELAKDAGMKEPAKTYASIHLTFSLDNPTLTSDDYQHAEELARAEGLEQFIKPFQACAQRLRHLH